MEKLGQLNESHLIPYHIQQVDFSSSGIDNNNHPRSSEISSGVSLLCRSCEKGFADPWNLMVHVQQTHSIDIFEEEAATAIKQQKNEV